MSAPAAKKRKGLSLDEKREVIQSIFFTTKDVFNLKDIEKLGAKEGVVMQSIKDVVQSLVDDKIVEVDKIGSGNFYWAFPSKAYIAMKTRAEDLAARAAVEEAACVELEAKLAALSAGREDTAGRAEKIRQLAALKAEREDLESKLKQYADSDPDALKEMEAKAVIAKKCSDRWTDNVWTLKEHLVSKYGKSPGEVDALMGIPDDFDYVS